MAAELIRLENDKSHGRKNQRGDRDFILGVMMLSLSAIIVKVIGLVYKIPMLRLLGSEGMGYFNSAYEIYALFCTVSTAGLPVAMSVMISRSRGKIGAEEKIFKVSLRFFLSLGAIGTLIMLILAYPLALFLGGGKCLFAILAISPTVFFICATSAYRGYYQGLGRMMPTAISQVIEAAGKLFLGVLFALVALSLGYQTEVVAAFAVLGLLIGSVLSMLYLWMLKRLGGQVEADLSARSRGIILHSLLKTAIPVTVSAAVVSVTRMVDMTMIIRRLQSFGQTSEAAFSAYGCYTTLAVPLFGIAPALVSSVALPLIPRLGRAISEGDREKESETINEGMRLASLISMPIGIGISLFSKEILELLFKGQSEEIELAAPLLSVLGMSVALSCLVTVGNAVLQAYGRPHIPTVSMTVGAILKVIFAYFLIGDPSIGIMGAPISTLICDLTIDLINFYYILKCVPDAIDVRRSFLRPFMAAMIAAAVSRLAFGAAEAKADTGGSLLTILAILFCALIYASLCLAFKVVRLDEIRKLRQKMPG